MKDTTKIVFPICRTCSKVHLCFMSEDTKDKCKKYAEYKSDVEIAQKGRAIPGEGGRMTVKEIIKTYLIDNGFDGLCNISCGCGFDDFMCCDGDLGDCQPAHKHKKDCKKCKILCDGFDYDVTGHCYKTEKPMILPETNEE